MYCLLCYNLIKSIAGWDHTFNKGKKNIIQMKKHTKREKANSDNTKM